jgi:hypothetical protein
MYGMSDYRLLTQDSMPVETVDDPHPRFFQAIILICFMFSDVDVKTNALRGGFPAIFERAVG